MKENKSRSKIGILKEGLSWWTLRILPFLILYVIVKGAFFAGYFQIFGSSEAQLVAHDFFVKGLITICAFITLLALHKFFFKFVKSVIYSIGHTVFYKKTHAENFSNVLSYILILFLYLTIFVIILNIWMSNAFGWVLDLMKSSTITIISFVFGLLASSVLGNIVSYYVLNKVKDVKPGDRIRIDDHYGDVMDVDFLFTHLRNLDNEIVSIPNILLVTKGIKNYTRYHEVVVHFDLSLPHGIDISRTKEIIIAGAKKTKDIISEKEPTVWFKEANSWAINCEVRAHTDKTRDLVQIRSDLVENVLSELRANKIPTGRDIKLYGNESHDDFQQNFPQG